MINAINFLDDKIITLERENYNLKSAVETLEQEERSITLKKAIVDWKKKILLAMVSFFNNNDKLYNIPNNVALYGAGEIAQAFITLCKNSRITISFTIDRSPKVVDNIPSYSIEQIPNTTIPIIITAYDQNQEIEKTLSKYLSSPIIYLEDLFRLKK